MTTERNGVIITLYSCADASPGSVFLFQIVRS
nr:MAG TPA: hypothetical protein [Bacteriophage sp.]